METFPRRTFYSELDNNGWLKALILLVMQLVLQLRENY